MIELEFEPGLTLKILFFLPILLEVERVDVRIKIGVMKYTIHAGASSDFHGLIYNHQSIFNHGQLPCK